MKLYHSGVVYHVRVDDCSNLYTRTIFFGHLSADPALESNKGDLRAMHTGVAVRCESKWVPRSTLDFRSKSGDDPSKFGDPRISIDQPIRSFAFLVLTADHLVYPNTCMTQYSLSI